MTNVLKDRVRELKEVLIRHAHLRSHVPVVDASLYLEIKKGKYLLTANFSLVCHVQREKRLLSLNGTKFIVLIQ